MKIIKSVILLIFLLTFGLNAQEEIDKMPKIKGGIKELAKNIKYPKSAKEEGITGTVFIKAVIDSDGNVIKATVEEGVSDELDAAAKTAVKKTKFIPGQDDGKNVKSEVTIPIKFKLDDKKVK